MKQVKAGMHIQVLRDLDRKLDPPNEPDASYQHLRVTEVIGPDTVKVDADGVELIAMRLGEPPLWRVNRFGVGG